MNKKKFDEAWLSTRERYFIDVAHDIEILKNKKVFEGKRIAIIGSWNNAREVREIIEKLGMKISIIADNNVRKQGVSRLGIISQSLESLCDEKDVVILVINNVFWKDIELQLLGLGLQKDKDFYVVFGGRKGWQYARGVDDQVIVPLAWMNYLARLHSGYKSYVRINKKYNGLPIWLMHQPSLGDLYIFASYLPIAMGKKSIAECDCVLIVTKNSVKKLAQCIGFKNIEILTFDEAHMEWLPLLRLAGNKINVHNAVFHGISTNFQTMVHYSDISFSESFTKWVFRFKEDVEPIYPSFPIRTEHVLQQFKENNLIPGKTVVISPYAGHFVAEISDAQWKCLVDGLKEKGYTVCTNVGGPSETAIEGTAAPFIELQDCVEFVNTAGYFIGVRSGFCDLICNSDCEKIVIYETGAPAGDISYFGFGSMKIGRNITELVNDCINTDGFIEGILERF